MESSQLFAFFNLSTSDLIIILVIVLLLFGAKKLPELSRSIGNAARELRNGLGGDDGKKSDQSETKTRQG